MISVIKLLRPQHWLKNILLFFPPFFAGILFNPSTTQVFFHSFLSFSLAASCGYIINDIVDKEADQCHSIKKNRAIATGAISITFAIIVASLLYIFALLVASAVSRRFEWYIIVYLFVSLSYTFYLKDHILYDIFLVSLGFLIRVLAGGEAFRVTVTNWLFLTVFSVSLMLATGKRLGELISLGDGSQKHRLSLVNYSTSFLEGILWFSAALSLITYALYSLEHSKGMFYTVPLAAFGLLRYIYVVKQGKGDPTEVLLADRHIMVTGILWVFINAAIIYIK